MQKLLTNRTRWMIAGWILFLALVLVHPLVLDALGKEHPPDCPLCAHYISTSAIIVAIFVLPFLVFIAYSLFSISQPLTSVVFLVPSGRAPPALF